MISTEVSAVLRHLRHLAADHNDHEQPDDQLLGRFVGRRDEAAFAALLRRHGPMVLGVCRNVLRDLHDAEDAFQATFLLLAQKAGSIHRRESVSGWLYRVAYHLAVRAGAAVARRRALEKKAVIMPSADPLLDMSLREVRGVLFEELEKMPEQYRTLLVLCSLEEKSREEAARLLGWSRNAVKGKLERGRQLLRSRLRRRGLELPAGLLAGALALNSASGQAYATLFDSTLRAAVRAAAGAGVISAKVAALVRQADKTMFAGKARLATALFLAMGVLASSFGAVWHQASAAEKREVQSDQVPESQGKDARHLPAVEDAVEVRGRVVDPGGKPVGGAKVYLNTHNPKAREYPVRATSGTDGRFAFSFNRSELDSTWTNAPTGTVIALAEGFGCDVATVGRAGESGELTLRLVKDVPVSGRVLDQEGNPVAGAKVSVTALQIPNGEDLTGPLEEFRKDSFMTSIAKTWNGPVPGAGAAAATGLDGRFRLSGLGRDRIVDLAIEAPGIEYARPRVMTRAGEAVVGPPQFQQAKILAATFDYLAAPARPIRGVVRDKETGKPVAGVRVESFGHTRATETDTEGRYELLGHAKSKTYFLMALPAAGQPYFTANPRVPDTPGFAPLVADIELIRGVGVRGRVTDKETGRPFRGADIRVFTLYPNPHAREGVGETASGVSSAVSGPDGSYSAVALPGPGIVAVIAPGFDYKYTQALVTLKDMKEFFKTWVCPEQMKSQYTDEMLLQAVGTHISAISQESYTALALIEPDPKAVAVTRDIPLERAAIVRGSITGPDGKSVVGATVFGLVPSKFVATTLDSAEFTVRGINPRRTRELLFLHAAKGLGYHGEMRGDEKGPLSIRLQPLGTASGRLVDKDGQPVARLHINVFRSRWFGPGGVQIKTDKDGRFRTAGLVPGQKYTLYPAERSLSLKRGFDIVVESGQDKYLGEITVIPDPLPRQ
jgi:RNA polymerase sigma factor (sigma-70 family)